MYEAFIDVEFSQKKISSLLSNNNEANDSVSRDVFQNAKMVSLNVPIRGLSDWQQIQNKLEIAELFKYTKTKYLTSNFVLLELNIDGMNIQNLLRNFLKA